MKLLSVRYIVVGWLIAVSNLSHAGLIIHAGVAQNDVTHDSGRCFTANSSTMPIGLTSLNQRNCGNFWDDVDIVELKTTSDLKFSEVPEPETVALFGVAVLVLLLVRKYTPPRVE